MKRLFTLYLLLYTGSVYSQEWGNSPDLDTLRNNKGQISSIINSYKGEVLYFDYFTTGGIRKRTFTTWVNDVKYEKTTSYFTNGNPSEEYFYKIIYTRIYERMYLDSTYFEFYDNGAIKAKRFYVQGKENGLSVLYYPDGKVESEMNYVDDKLMAVKFYDKDGNSLHTGDFKDGNGRLIQYEYGVKLSICLFKNGKVVKRSCTCN